MNPTLVATLAGLSCAVLWGTSDWLTAKSSKRLKPVQINAGVQTVGSILAVGLLLISDYRVPAADQIWRIFLGTVFITAAYLLFIKALSGGALGIIAPIGNAYALITVTLSVIFLNQDFSLAQLGAMLAIIAGSAALAYEKNRKNIPLKELHKDTLLAVAAAVSWGVAFFVINPVASDISWQSMAITSQIFMWPLALLPLFITYRSRTLLALREAMSYKKVLAIGLVGNVGGWALYVGASYAGSIVIPTVLSGGGPLVASMLGAVMDHERLGVLKRVGAVIVVTGIIILNIG